MDMKKSKRKEERERKRKDRLVKLKILDELEHGDL